MNKEHLKLIEKLKHLKERTASFKSQYEMDSKNPDIDYLTIEVNKVKEVVLAYTDVKNNIAEREDNISMLFSYLNEEKFASDQDKLVQLLKIV